MKNAIARMNATRATMSSAARVACNCRTTITATIARITRNPRTVGFSREKKRLIRS